MEPESRDVDLIAWQRQEEERWYRELEGKRERKRRPVEFMFTVGGEPPNFVPRRHGQRSAPSRWDRMRELVHRVADGRIPLNSWICIQGLARLDVGPAGGVAQGYAKLLGLRCRTHRDSQDGAEFLWMRFSRAR